MFNRRPRPTIVIQEVDDDVDEFKLRFTNFVIDCFRMRMELLEFDDGVANCIGFETVRIAWRPERGRTEESKAEENN